MATPTSTKSSTSHDQTTDGSGDHGDEQSTSGGLTDEQRTYLRFGAMILTSMVLMYFVMFTGSWELSHVRFSQSRVFMAITMGGTMGLVMLAWMLNMYSNVKGNIAIVGSVCCCSGAASPWIAARPPSVTCRSCGR